MFYVEQFRNSIQIWFNCFVHSYSTFYSRLLHEYSMISTLAIESIISVRMFSGAVLRLCQGFQGVSDSFMIKLSCKKISPLQGLQGRFCGICSKMSGSLTGSNLGLFTAENPESRQILLFTGEMSEKLCWYAIYKPCMPVCRLLCWLSYKLPYRQTRA